MATHIPTTSRRRLLNAAPAVMVMADAGIGTAVAAHAPQLDAELIETCRQFAEAELTGWYRYVTAPDTQADEEAADALWVFDRATWEWIAATPATTPEGWQAKALAFVALDRNAYDDAEDCDRNTPVLASLMRDMVRPARDAIIARLIGVYGPMPAGYTPNGMWMGQEAALALAGAAASGVQAAEAIALLDPDADLHSLCAEYQRLHALAYLEGSEDWASAHDESLQVADKINDLVPVTEAGHRAKAAVVVTEMDSNRTNSGDWMGDTEAFHALTTLKDWLGMAA